MEIIISFLVGLAFGLLVNQVRKPGQPRLEKADEGLIVELKEHRRRNIGKIKTHLRNRKTITNREVERLLKVSDATAERYLDELEKEGLLKQVGRIGRNVRYSKIG